MFLTELSGISTAHSIPANDIGGEGGGGAGSLGGTGIRRGGIGIGVEVGNGVGTIAGAGGRGVAGTAGASLPHAAVTNRASLNPIPIDAAPFLSVGLVFKWTHF